MCGRQILLTLASAPVKVLMNSNFPWEGLFQGLQYPFLPLNLVLVSSWKLKTRHKDHSSFCRRNTSEHLLLCSFRIKFKRKLNSLHRKWVTQPATYRDFPSQQMSQYLKSHAKLKLSGKHAVHSAVSAVIPQIKSSMGCMSTKQCKSSRTFVQTMDKQDEENSDCV